ncbi:hypothetical protein TNCV_1499271 [Trichonephila clavipes]|nr:hypothetical protein TNCV_1499271 [Trichonephila clavipes]
METGIKPSSAKYRDTASGFLAKKISDYVDAHSDRFQFLRNTSTSTPSNETKCHEPSPKNFVPVHIIYTTFDPKEGPDKRLAPIILQHAALSSKENWGNIPQILADETKRKVFVLDARSHGDSGWSEASDRKMFAQDLIHFMNTNGITKCILIGHSMGGMSGLLAALMQPAMFEMLFLEDCAVGPLPQKLRNLLPIYGNLLQDIVSEIPPNANEDEAWIFIKEKMKTLMPKDSLNIKKRHSRGLPITLKQQLDGRYSLKADLAAATNFLTSPPDPKAWGSRIIDAVVARLLIDCFFSVEGCGSPVVKVSDHSRQVMISSPVSLKTCRVGP